MAAHPCYQASHSSSRFHLDTIRHVHACRWGLVSHDCLCDVLGTSTISSDLDKHDLELSLMVLCGSLVTLVQLSNESNSGYTHPNTCGRHVLQQTGLIHWLVRATWRCFHNDSHLPRSWLNGTWMSSLKLVALGWQIQQAETLSCFENAIHNLCVWLTKCNNRYSHDTCYIVICCTRVFCKSGRMNNLWGSNMKACGFIWMVNRDVKNSKKNRSNPLNDSECSFNFLQPHFQNFCPFSQKVRWLPSQKGWISLWLSASINFSQHCEFEDARQSWALSCWKKRNSHGKQPKN